MCWDQLQNIFLVFNNFRPSTCLDSLIAFLRSRSIGELYDYSNNYIDVNCLVQLHNAFLILKNILGLFRYQNPQYNFRY